MALNMLEYNELIEMEYLMELYFAPMQGMTTANYRNHHHKIFGGFDAYCAPFIATSDVRKVGKPLFKDILPENNIDMNILPQLISNKGQDFDYYANLLLELGYKEINLNMGCPYATVTKKKKGSGILQYPKIVKDILEASCHKPYDVTVKMRLGMEDLDEGFEIMEVLNAYPLKNVTIHGRTGLQKYEGTVDLEAFEALYEACQHEVIYNGDIFTVEDYKKIQTRFPRITKFMLGRGALQDPFLGAAIKGAVFSNEEKMQMIKQLHDGVYDHYKNVLYGDKHLCDKMKEFWMHTSLHLDPSGKILKKIRKSRTSSEYMIHANKLLDPNNQWLIE